MPTPALSAVDALMTLDEFVCCSFGDRGAHQRLRILCAWRSYTKVYPPIPRYIGSELLSERFRRRAKQCDVVRMSPRLCGDARTKKQVARRITHSVPSRVPARHRSFDLRVKILQLFGYITRARVNEGESSSPSIGQCCERCLQHGHVERPPPHRGPGAPEAANDRDCF